MEEQGNQAALKNLFSGLKQKVHFVKYFFTKFYTVWHQATIQENHFEKFLLHILLELQTNEKWSKSAT